MENIYIENSYNAPGWRNYMNNSEAIQAYKQYYKTVFAGLDITKIHDCSMGSGGLTFPLCELGYIEIDSENIFMKTDWYAVLTRKE